jgi:hypothetical protein
MLGVSSFIKYLRSKAHDNLVASEIGIGGKHEELASALCYDGFSRECHSALVDQIEFLEFFSFGNDFTPRQEYSTVERRQKVGSKFLASLKFLFIFEHIVEVLFKITEELIHKLISNLRLQLVEEVKSETDLGEVKKKTCLYVILYGVICTFWKMFSGAPTLIQFANPCFELIYFLINNILHLRFLNQYVIDRAH